MTRPDQDSSFAEGVAERLTGCADVTITQVGGGRNSRVYRVETGSGVFALKQYPSREDDPRDRLGTEVGALVWMEDHAFAMVPRVIATDRNNNFALLSWVEGALVRDVRETDVDQALVFLGRLHALRETSAISPERLATEACLSGAEIERQIHGRVVKLRGLEGEDALHRFVDDEFNPVFQSLLSDAKKAFSAQDVSFDSDLAQGWRSLIPSDFGYHNALRRGDGQVTFIDFEYFGWDDPVKLVADVLWHPGTPVAPHLRQRFRQAAEILYGADPRFTLRLAAFYPLFGLRWALILLNEFHPERWRRRLLAGETTDWAGAKNRQLQAARTLLAQVAQNRRS